MRLKIMRQIVGNKAKRPPKGFAVLKYFISPIFDADNSIVEYEQYFGNDDAVKAKNKTITKDQALLLIKRHQMTKVVENQYGVVWE